MAEPRALTSILDLLLVEGVDFVLVGALAAVAQGAPLTTHDVDIVHARTEDNLDRLMRALAKLRARDLGPLDCLGAIENGLTHEDLLPLSVPIDFDGKTLHVLSRPSSPSRGNRRTPRTSWSCQSSRRPSGASAVERPALVSCAESRARRRAAGFPRRAGAR